MTGRVGFRRTEAHLEVVPPHRARLSLGLTQGRQEEEKKKTPLSSYGMRCTVYTRSVNGVMPRISSIPCTVRTTVRGKYTVKAFSCPLTFHILYVLVHTTLYHTPRSVLCVCSVFLATQFTLPSPACCHPCLAWRCPCRAAPCPPRPPSHPGRRLPSTLP